MQLEAPCELGGGCNLLSALVRFMRHRSLRKGVPASRELQDQVMSSVSHRWAFRDASCPRMATQLRCEVAVIMPVLLEIMWTQVCRSRHAFVMADAAADAGVHWTGMHYLHCAMHSGQKRCAEAFIPQLLLCTVSLPVLSPCFCTSAFVLIQD